MYGYVSAGIYPSLSLSVYIYIHTHIYIYILTNYVFIYIYIFLYIIRLYIYICVCNYACIYNYIYMCVCDWNEWTSLQASAKDWPPKNVIAIHHPRKGWPHHDFTISTGRTFPVEHRGMYCVGSNSKGNGLYKSLIPNHCGGSSI